MAIRVAHFQSERSAPNVKPTWPEAEKLLNKILEPKKNVISVSAYPSAMHHNLIIVFEDGDLPTM